MFGLFDGNSSEFYIKERDVTNILKTLNSFNITDVHIIADASDNGIWKIGYKADPSVLNAIRVFLNDKVIWSLKDVEK